MAADPARALATRARAKVNLTLRVLGRRADGYHELDSLVAFAGVGDALSLVPDASLGLTVAGPFGAGLAVNDDNLVLKAARGLAAVRPGLRLGAFHLVKLLPVASGIGGGSADAAGALRLLARANGLEPEADEVMAVARSVGADVPVCVASRARVMAGVGERLGPPLKLPPLFAVLVNPGVAVETAAVFRSLGLAAGQGTGRTADVLPPVETGVPLIDALGMGGNDLEAPACAVVPVIDTVLAALSALPGCRLARMSGSGGTCFALFDDCRASAHAAKALSRARPDWWVKATLLR